MTKFPCRCIDKKHWWFGPQGVCGAVVSYTHKWNSFNQRYWLTTFLRTVNYFMMFVLKHENFFVLLSFLNTEMALVVETSSHGHMMTSSNGNIFRITGPLCGEFTGHRWILPQRPVTWSFDVFFDLPLNKRLSKQSRRWWFETPSWSLWRHCNEQEHVCLLHSQFHGSGGLVRQEPGTSAAMEFTWLCRNISVLASQGFILDIYWMYQKVIFEHSNSLALEYISKVRMTLMCPTHCTNWCSRQPLRLVHCSPVTPYYGTNPLSEPMLI